MQNFLDEDFEIIKDTSKIPIGVYCYTLIGSREWNGIKIPKLKRCPYWDKDYSKPHQENGYCYFLERGDWDNPTVLSLLWDQVKECGINWGDDYEEEWY